MKKLLLLFLLLSTSHLLKAQSSFIPHNRDYYHLIDRFQIKYAYGERLLSTTFKPLRRSDLAEFLGKIQGAYDSLSSADKFNFEFLMNDNWEFTKSPYNENPKNWFDMAYLQKSDFYYQNKPNYTLRINPVFDFSIGNDPDNERTLYTNTRGAEAQGTIDNKIGFYTFLTTTQIEVPAYVIRQARSARAFPNEGFWKNSGREYDVTHARGYFTFNLTKSIDIQAGYDKKFIGQGLRSMVLSDFSSPFLFGQINTRLGKFQYTNLFGQLTSDITFASAFTPGDGDYPTKVFSFHRIGVNILPNLELGLFETIISEEANINYFNPIIFYRAIEQHGGSPDNTLLGLDLNYTYKNKIQFYGQFILDEFLIDALRDGNGDWRNKFGVQLGTKYIDAFDINTLDLQIEYNAARPYFFAYEDPTLSYTNYRNPLAHPFGANFREILLTARYQPKPKVFLYAKLFRSKRGLDQNGRNFGGNLLLSTNDRIGNTGNTIGQGLETNITFAELSASYMFMHNVFLELRSVYRNQNNSATVDGSSFINMISLRWNLPQRQHEF